MILYYGSSSKLTQASEHYLLYFTDKGAEDQRGEITCLRPHSWQGAEPGFKLSSACSTAFIWESVLVKDFLSMISHL